MGIQALTNVKCVLEKKIGNNAKIWVHFRLTWKWKKNIFFLCFLAWFQLGTLSFFRLLSTFESLKINFEVSDRFGEKEPLCGRFYDLNWQFGVFLPNWNFSKFSEMKEKHFDFFNIFLYDCSLAHFRFFEFCKHLNH